MSAPVRVLIVDDDPDFQEFVCALFELEGYQPHAAFDGNTALELYEEVRPDVVLLDIMMPGMDGYELCRRMRKAYADDQVPIIFVSAKVEEKDIALGEKAGGDDYVAKPFDFPQLLAAVDRCLGQSEG